MAFPETYREYFTRPVVLSLILGIWVLRWVFINYCNFLLSSQIVCFSILIAFVPIWSSVYTTQVVTPQVHLKYKMLSYLKQTFNEHCSWKVYIFQFSKEFLATRSPCVCDFRPNAWWDCTLQKIDFYANALFYAALMKMFH